MKMKNKVSYKRTKKWKHNIVYTIISLYIDDKKKKIISLYLKGKFWYTQRYGCFFYVNFIYQI